MLRLYSTKTPIRAISEMGIHLINSSELQFLFLSAYLTHNTHILNESQRHLALSLEWSEILSLANRFQISPYLSHFIKLYNLQSYVPESHLKSLEASYQNQAMQTIYLKRQLLDINKNFTKNNISYCLIKGAELIETIYQATPIRPMSDIDILSSPKDIDAIVEILTQLGYYQKTMHQGNKIQSIATYRKHYPAFFHNKRHTIEVHFNLFPNASNQHDLTRVLWAHAKPINNSSQLRLNVDHHFLYLCHHLAYHIQSPREGLVLYWFFDIYQWIKQYQTTIGCPLFHLLHPKDREKIDEIFQIIDNQWIKPEKLQTSFFKTETMLEAVLNRHLREKRLDKKKRVLSYYRQMWCDKHPQWSTFDRFTFWFRLLFPKFSYLEDRYHVKQKWSLPLYCIANPFMVMFRAIKRLIH